MALAMPSDGIVVTMDITDQYWNTVGQRFANVSLDLMTGSKENRIKRILLCLILFYRNITMKQVFEHSMFRGTTFFTHFMNASETIDK